MSDDQTITNALSFDIEDWFHIVGIEGLDEPERWPTLPTLVERCTDGILETLAARRVRATFFILGWIAERYPALVRRIGDQGHELASHSYWHRRVFDLSPQEFDEDLARSIDAIESASGRRVIGYRAPSFSITPGSEWAIDALLKRGLRYDASLFPVPRGDGGYPCEPGPHHFRGMPELPMSTMSLFGRRLAFSGGGYLRLLPPWLIRRGFSQVHAKGLPVVVYLHPRDFAPDCPRVPMPLSRRFKCYVGLRTTQAKLEMLLGRYRFDTCAAVLGVEASADATVEPSQAPHGATRS